MSAPDYPAERIARYVVALNQADTHAQLTRRDDSIRFARAVMAVADAETVPVYKSGYDTGRMHARSRGLLDGAAELERIADEVEARVATHYGETSGIGPGSADMVREAARTLLSMAGEKSSRPTADATPTTGRCPGCRLPFEECKCGGGVR